MQDGYRILESGKSGKMAKIYQHHKFPHAWVSQAWGKDEENLTHFFGHYPVCLGFQDFSQLTRDYGDKESKVIQNTVGNVFSGQVVGETAKTLSERFGKVFQQRQSMTINRNDKSTSISTQMDCLIPASKISNLTQGMFVGAVSDNFDERIDQKIFHAEIVVDSAKVSAEMEAYQPIPVVADFTNEDGSDNLKETIEANYRKVKQEILSLVDSEILLSGKLPNGTRKLPEAL